MSTVAPLVKQVRHNFSKVPPALQSAGVYIPSESFIFFGAYKCMDPLLLLRNRVGLKGKKRAYKCMDPLLLLRNRVQGRKEKKRDKEWVFRQTEMRSGNFDGNVLLKSFVFQKDQSEKQKIASAVTTTALWKSRALSTTLSVPTPSGHSFMVHLHGENASSP
ncbi:hypothetical protein CEXT_35591 [Caerostris extrusa]|uniref:Uncharacterized protein n=1 Tax=Caerostris extrusa TaxID=172846 RepID=A0AAV4NZB6_CAEEX|nr:hypothetical protein CEXT_35591 [Caerostris extrusa]